MRYQFKEKLISESFNDMKNVLEVIKSTYLRITVLLANSRRWWWHGTGGRWSCERILTGWHSHWSISSTICCWLRANWLKEIWTIMTMTTTVQVIWFVRPIWFIEFVMMMIIMAVMMITKWYWVMVDFFFIRICSCCIKMWWCWWLVVMMMLFVISILMIAVSCFVCVNVAIMCFVSMENERKKQPCSVRNETLNLQLWFFLHLTKFLISTNCFFKVNRYALMSLWDRKAMVMHACTCE